MALLSPPTSLTLVTTTTTTSSLISPLTTGAAHATTVAASAVTESSTAIGAPDLAQFGVFFNAIFLYTLPSVNVVIQPVATVLQNINTLLPTTVTLTDAAVYGGLPTVYSTVATITSWPTTPALHLESYSTPVTINITPGSFAVPTGTTSSISPVLPTQTGDSASGGYSSGATAGIAIVSAVAAILVAAVVAWLFIRRRRRHSTYGSPPTPSDASGAGLTGHHHGGDMAMVRGARSDALLPAPMEESAIAKEMSKLETFFRNHAYSFFSPSMDSKIRMSVTNDAHLHALLGDTTPVSASALSSLLADVKSRTAAVRFVLAWCILRSIQSEGEHSLLPAGLHGCMRPSVESKDRLEIAARWRQMTGVLISSNTKDLDASQQLAIDSLTTQLNTVLADYASSDTERQRTQNLRELVKLGAHFGHVLLTQPTAWTFDWGEEHGRRRNELVVFPALIQTGDDRGHMLLKPMAYSGRQVASI